MQPAGYSPYTSAPKREKRFKMPKISGGAKKWIFIVLGVLIGLFIIFYLLLGELRFFANNYLRLTFFNKNYLILLQNNYESRPGGGFITAYGNLDTFMGFPTNLSFHNSYEVDTDTYVNPPYPHEDMLRNEWYEGYTFRDANWNPNFPDAAIEIMDFYLKKFPDRDVDGIFVMNFTMIENLVEKFGGIEVNDNTYTKETLFSAITDTVNDVDRHNEEALLSRKDILSDLAGVLFSKVKWHPFKSKSVIVEALNGKDLYFWFDSAGMQRKVVEKGWANTLEPLMNADFLAVNIANLGSKKADRYVIKEVHHYVNITKEIPEVTTEITVRYPGFTNAYADDYKGYLQLMIPGDAVVNADLLDSRMETVGAFKVIGEKIILPAGSKTTLAYTYTLPRTLLNVDEYKLRLIKQSGDKKWYWVTVEVPSDRLVDSDDFEARENRGMFAEVLESDKDLTLNLLADTAAPYPIEQVFSDLSTISIYWNEPINLSIGNDPNNYVITDTNYADSAFDEVTVVSSEIVDASVSKLTLEGVTKQNLERYQIEVKNIKDASGNEINPNPKIITAVQRIIETEEEEVDALDVPAE
ncbi:DUF4012 domain-containing protein [Patescibacteria group bacterium]|nr:DUF4012 domain-containing protein [Patescibacteria group bacterium]